MRESLIFTASLPKQMVKQVEQWSKKNTMTKSELVRAALRRYFEEAQLDEALRLAEKERITGVLSVLPRGGLQQLLKK